MRRSTRSGFWGTVGLVLALGLLAVPAGAAVSAPLAAAHITPIGIEWQPAISYEKMVLTVSGPGDLILRREFAAGDALAFEAFAEGKPLPDGSYTYELIASPVLDRETRQALARSRETGDESIVTKLRAEGKLPRGPLVQSGTFQVSNGAVQQPELREAPAPRPSGSGSPLLKDVVTPDDSIIQGSLCVGLDCVNNENFGFDTIRLKENNTRIHFDDTSTGVGFPANDWTIIANDSASGGASKFSIEDRTGAKTPFTITAGAATNSIFVDSTGRLGLRTSTPVLDLHINTSNTPAIRMEQNNSGGFTAQTWDIAGNEANFFVRDVTGGSRLPFRIRPGAPTSSIDISADGDVGIGTASPSAEVTIKSDASNGDVANVENSTVSSTTIFRIFETSDNGGVLSLFDSTGAENVRLSAPGNNWIDPPAGGLSIKCKSNFTGADLTIGSNDNCTTAPNSTINAGSGSFTTTSSRSLKEHLTTVGVDSVLDRIAKVPVYTYDFIRGPKDVMGLVAEDFHQVFGRGSDKLLNNQEVQMALWLAVQELTKQNKALTEKLEQLETQFKATGQQP